MDDRDRVTGFVMGASAHQLVARLRPGGYHSSHSLDLKLRSWLRSLLAARPSADRALRDFY